MEPAGHKICHLFKYNTPLISLRERERIYSLCREQEELTVTERFGSVTLQSSFDE